MQKEISNKIEKFAKLTGLTERVTISHGTLYVTLLQPERDVISSMKSLEHSTRTTSTQTVA